MTTRQSPKMQKQMRDALKGAVVVDFYYVPHDGGYYVIGFETGFELCVVLKSDEVSRDE